MPHKCIRCGAVYEDDDASILRGCKCGSIFFLYVKGPEDEKKIEEIEKELKERKTTLEKEVKKKIEEKKEEEKKTGVKRPAEEIKFGVETIRIPREGVYEINIDALMKGRPLIILERGRVYFIHLPSAFEKIKKS